jgi:hypothetical protein
MRPAPGRVVGHDHMGFGQFSCRGVVVAALRKKRGQCRLQVWRSAATADQSRASGLLSQAVAVAVNRLADKADARSHRASCGALRVFFTVVGVGVGRRQAVFVRPNISSVAVSELTAPEPANY